MSKSVQWLLLLLTVSICIQISVSRFINSYPTSTEQIFIQRAVEPRLPCPLDNIYRCCDVDDPSNNTCCFGFRNYNDSDNCIANRNCKYFISYHYDNDTHYSHTSEDGVNHYYVDNLTEYGWINFTIQSRAGIGYTAYGISYDEKMGSDLVIVCELTESYKVKMYITWNYERNNFKLDPVKIKQHKFFEVNLAKYEDNIVTCSFGMPTRFYVEIREPRYFNFSMIRDVDFDDYFVGFLAGGKVVDGKLGNHEETYITAYSNNHWSYTNFCIIDASIPFYIEERVHGCFMVICFTFMIPIVTFMTRFYKDYLLYRPPILNWEKSLYYLLHVYFGTGSFMVFLGAFSGVAATRSRKFVVRVQFPSIIHSIIGYFILGVFTFQFVIGLYRRKTPLVEKTKVLHASVGWTLHFFGAIGLFAAPFVTMNILPCHFAVYPVIWLCAHTGFYRYLSNYMDKVHEELGHHYNQGRSLFMFPFPPVRRSVDRYPWKVLVKRRKILAAFVSTSVVLTVIMLFYLSVDLDAPCFPAHKRKTRHMNQERFFK